MRRLLVALILVASAAHGEIYTWKDSRGTSHYANRPDDIPPRYRSRAKPLNYDVGKGGEGTQLPPPGQAPPVSSLPPVPSVPSGEGGATPRQQTLPAEPAAVTPAVRQPTGTGARPERIRRGRTGHRSGEE
jgi:uncharacterized protein DUF4124